MNETPSEETVRALRDQVYGVPATNQGWDACKENWMKPKSVEWLKEHAAKVLSLNESPCARIV